MQKVNQKSNPNRSPNANPNPDLRGLVGGVSATSMGYTIALY